MYPTAGGILLPCRWRFNVAEAKQANITGFTVSLLGPVKPRPPGSQAGSPLGDNWFWLPQQRSGLGCSCRDSSLSTMNPTLRKDGRGCFSTG